MPLLDLQVVALGEAAAADDRAADYSNLSVLLCEPHSAVSTVLCL